MGLFKLENISGGSAIKRPSDIEKIQILKTRDEVDKYLVEVLRLKPKIIAFDYADNCCSMCWQLIKSSSWEWINTDAKLFRKILESNDIGKTNEYHEKEMKWIENRFKRTKINNLIEYDSRDIIKEIRKIRTDIPTEKILKYTALNSLYKYQTIADQIIELGII